jgi:hypothetical protein
LTQADVRARGRVIGISEGAATVALVDDRGTSIVDRQTWAERHRVPTTRPVIRVDLMPQNRALLTLDASRTEKVPFFPSWVAYAGHRLSLWDLAQHRELGSVDVERASASATSLAPGGNRVLVAVGGGGPAIIDPQAGVRLATLEAPGGEVIAAALTHRGGNAVGVGQDHSVRFWDIPSGETLAVHEAPEIDAEALAASDDGRWLVIAGHEPVRTTQGWTFIRDMRLHEAFAGLEPPTARPVTSAVVAQTGGAATATDGASTRAAQRLDPAFLREWYVAQGFPDWSASLPSQPGEPREASLSFARANWLANHPAAAAAEFDRLSARATDPTVAAYLRLCAAACRSEMGE